MRGQVLKRDGADGPGVILGDDGRRFRFSQAQARNGAMLAEGAVVDFIDLGDEARDIYLIPPVKQAAPAAIRTSAATVSPLNAAVRSDGLWTYFLRALSRNYFQFDGRARRAEYWGFTFFMIIVLITALIIDGVISLTVFETDEYGNTVFIPVLTILFYLYCVIPGIAITVRRLHDLDMSGWMYLLGFIPYVGGLILFVFMVLDSKPEPNRHGPSPKYAPAQMVDTFS